MLFQQANHSQGLEGWHQGGALFPDVAAVDDGLDDAGVGGGTANTQFFEMAHQRRFGVARRRLGFVSVCGKILAAQFLAFFQRRKVLFAVLQFGAGVVAAFDIGTKKSGEGNGVAAGRKDELLGAGGGGDFAPNFELNPLSLGILHLRSQGALPNQFVDFGFVVAKLLAHHRRRPEVVASGPNRFVRLLGVLDLASVLARLGGHVVVAVKLGDLLARSGDGCFRERGAVGTHVGDIAVLVEALGRTHGARRTETQFAASFLLQRGGHERRRWRALVGLGDKRGDLEASGPKCFAESLGLGFTKNVMLLALGLERAVLAEAFAAGQPFAVQGNAVGFDRSTGSFEGPLDVEVLGGYEGDAGLLALGDDAGCDALHTPGAQPPAVAVNGHDLLPQHRRNFVAVKSIEDAPCLLRVHQAAVDVPGIVDGVLNSLGRDFVKNHAFDRHFGLEDLQQMPGDALSLAVFICCQQNFRGVLDQLFQFADVRLLLGIEDVDGAKVVVDVDTEPSPAGLLVLLWDIRAATGQVTNVSNGRFHHVVRTKEGCDGTGFGGRLNYHDRLAHGPSG